MIAASVGSAVARGQPEFGDGIRANPARIVRSNLWATSRGVPIRPFADSVEDDRSRAMSDLRCR
ncbi:MAG TPA: hypothetical protein DCQ98_14535 [Planctomycetaceae bacterium]|nr:hypothetical protein [Planctomycetaceae bacterium]